MKQQFLLGCLLVLLTGSVTAQNFRLSGTVTDSTGNPLPFATAVVLQASDSVMSQFGITDNQGKFTMPGLKQGDYILQLTFVGYQSRFQNLTVKADRDLGNIALQQQNVNLNEFEVEAEVVPIAIKNDTVEYNAEAFKTQPNAAVEDLLKQLPGVEVEKDGTVSAQGEQVNRVLVDGKEFFGNDPKIATKNLPADAIEKVQVFDKQSDMAEFTGVDDGDRTKTINLLLKEGKKAGYFGNATGGYGVPDDRFDGKLNLNRYTKKTQFSALGMANNINEEGFSLDDYVNFMGGFRNLMRSGLGSFQDGRPTASLGAANQSGINTVYAGGLNFNYELNKKTELISSYFYNRVRNDLETETTREYFNNDFNFDTRELSDERSEVDNHRLNLRVEHDIDSTQDLRVRANVQYNDGFTEYFSNQFSLLEDGTVRNAQINENRGEGTGLDINTNATYRKKFGRSGRNLVIRGNLVVAEDDRETNLNAITSLDISDTLRQFQDYRSTRLNFGGEVRYTEPLGKARYLELRYAHQENNTTLDKDFFDVDASSETRTFNAALSNEYDNTYRFDRGTVNFQISRDKYNLTAGVAAQQSELDGELINLETNINKSFFNVLPSARFVYRFTNSKRVQLRYRTSVNEPSIEQLQPVVDNSNPLQVYVGNPDLKAAYAHSLRLRYMAFSQFTFSSFFATLNATYTSNSITNTVAIDSQLVQLTQPVNVDRDINVNTYVAYSTPIRPLKVKINVRPSLVYNRSILFVNAVENNSDRLVSSVNFSVDNRKKEDIDIRVGAKFSHNLTNYSENTDLNQTFFTSNYYTDLVFNLSDRWTLSSTFDYTVYTGQAFADNEAIPVWQGSVSRFLFNDKRGELKLSVFDILDQNQGFSRNSTFNYIEEQRSNALGRYYLVSFTYALRGFKKPSGGWWSRFGDSRR